MATVTNILDRAARITGLRMTSTERDLALEALQDVYRQVVSQTESYLSTATYNVTESVDGYALDDVLSGVAPLKLAHVSIENGGVQSPLQQVSLQELLDLRDTFTGEGGSPFYYAANGFTGLEFYPNPAAGDVINVVYIADVPTLVEFDPQAGEEITPTQVPEQFHFSILLPGIVLQMLEKDQRLAEADLWQGRFDRGMNRMQEWIGQFGGEFNRAYVAKGAKRWRFNDQRSRF